MPNNKVDANYAALAFDELMRATEWSRRHVYRHLAAVRLTASQFAALQALYLDGPLSQGELARRIGKSNGDLTTVVDNLEKRLLVQRERSLTDRRVIQVVLSDEGSALVRQSLPQHSAAVEQIFDKLQEPEVSELLRLCRKLNGRVSAI